MTDDPREPAMVAQGTQNANVVCRMLGYPRGASRFVTRSGFGHKGDNFVLDDLKCTGSENSVFECPHAGIGVDNCGAREWFGVECVQ